MNRYEYLETLDRLLTSLPYSERREIMYDYEEHFKEGLNEGKTEDEIVADLGAPEKIASQYATALVPLTPEPNTKQTHAENQTPSKPKPVPQPVRRNGNNIGEIIALSIIMLLFNSIFIAFYATYWALLISFVALGAALFISGLAVLISAIVATPIAIFSIPAVFLQYPVMMFIGSVILISIGGLILIAMFYLIKFTAIFTVKYVKWTIQLIRGF